MKLLVMEAALSFQSGSGALTRCPSQTFRCRLRAEPTNVENQDTLCQKIFDKAQVCIHGYAERSGVIDPILF
jgi:hypothetical protein